MGIIDSSYKKEIIIAITVPIVRTFKKGKHVTQLSLLPFVMSVYSDCPRTGNFGSFLAASADPLVAFTLQKTYAH